MELAMGHFAVLVSRIKKYLETFLVYYIPYNVTMNLTKKIRTKNTRISILPKFFYSSQPKFVKV